MYTSTKAGLSSDQVYALLKGIWGNSDEWVNSHPAVKKYTTLKDALKGLSIPLHPGAVKFYKEQGLNVPQALIE